VTPARHDRFFRTDSVRADLRGHSVRSGFIAIGARVAQALLQLVGVVVLARILTPADFGIIAYVVPLAILVTVIANGALQSAVIHRAELDQAQASRVFREAALINFGLCTALAAASPLIARFYEEPRAAGVAIAWAAIIYCASLAAVPEALLKRQMRFGTVMGAHVVGLVIGTAGAIAAALAGAQYWALLIQVAAPPPIRSAVVWIASGWRPSSGSKATPRSPGPLLDDGLTLQPADGVAAIRRYWAGLAGFTFVTWAGDQLDRVLVGFTGSAATLGFYDGARRWGWYPLTELIISLNDVAVSSFSHAYGNDETFRGYVRKGLLPALALPLPLIAFVFVAAEDVILVLLGDQWLSAAPFLRLMCIAAFVGAPNRLTPWIYLSRGQTARQLRWAVFQTVVTIAALLAGATAGPIGVAAAFTAVTCALAWPGVAYAVRESPLSVDDVVRIVARPALASIAAAAVLQVVHRDLLPITNAIVRTGSAAVLFAAMFVVIWIVLPGGRAATREAIDALREMDPRPSRGGRK
jgi:PST family polysaccharide transporter